MDEPTDLSISKACEQVLEDVERVAEAPTTRTSLSDAGNAVAHGENRMVGGPDVAGKLTRIHNQIQQALQYLREEPFITRVLVEGEDGSITTYYFCRATPPSENRAVHGKLASYKSPIGRLAEFPPGEEFEIVIANRPRSFRVVERMELKPRRADGTWDALENRLQYGAHRRSIPSLRQFLDAQRPAPEPAGLDDLWAEIEREKAVAATAIASQEGFRREARRTLSLRDQAVLDQFQGNVFRLPLGQRILLSGPPGTGKTTTLIKRLAQKLDPQFWDEAERERLGSREQLARGWVMFSPTDLLKLYLKEAFNKEQVPASEQHVKTWDDERSRLARDVLGILKSVKSGRFVLKKEAHHLLDETSPYVWSVYEAFQTYLEGDMLRRYRDAFDYALGSEVRLTLRELVNRMRSRIGAKATVEVEHLYDMIELQSELAQPVEELGNEIKQRSEAMVNALNRAYPGLIEDIAARVDTLIAAAGTMGTTPTEEDADDGEDVVADIGASAKRKAIDAVVKGLRWLAREIARSASLKPSARYYELVKFMGHRCPSDDDLRELGRLQILRTHLTFLSEGHKNLIERIPDAFQRFRRQSLQEERFYRSDVRERIMRNEISPAELDVVILAMLRSVRRLTARQDRRWMSNTPLAILEAIEGEYRMQVLVDEATDFSAVQLGCMLGLSHPLFSSLFASGDLRQRMTTCGIRSLDELRRMWPDFEIHEVSTGYRQSPQLTRFSQRLAALVPGPEVGIQPFYDEQSGDVPPVLCEGVSGAALADWLAARILEIERALHAVPSVAVFVGSEEEIVPLESMLKPRLEEHNVMVRACMGGRDVGSENEIRVFSARYIKGLEFEAVFFVGVDRINALAPDLFAQMLYVGATRATRYLGITCEDVLPGLLGPLRPEFGGGSWS